MRKTFIALLAFAITAACTQEATDSGDSADFYATNNVTYIVSTNPGGGYDTYARLISNYLQKYLPAENVVIRNVPGAGHMVGANTLWRSKPDGLTIGTFNAGLIYGQLVGKAGMNYDLREFEWIGKAAGESRSIVVSNECAIKSIEDLIASDETIKFGSAGIGSASYSDTMLLADAFDLNISVVPGFEGTSGEMSMMRGEICAILGSTSSLQNFVSSGNGNFIVSIGDRIEDVPYAMDLAKTDRAKRLVSIVDALAQLGRVSAAPPGTPKNRVEQMRAAYKASLEDPSLLAEAKKMGRPIDPAFGEDVRELVVNALDQTPDTIELVKKAINGAQQ